MSIYQAFFKNSVTREKSKAVSVQNLKHTMALCYTHVEMFRPTGVKLVVRSLSYNMLASKEAVNYGVEKKERRRDQKNAQRSNWAGIGIARWVPR